MLPVTRTYSEELGGKIKVEDGLWRPEEVILGLELEFWAAMWAGGWNPWNPGPLARRTVSVQELQVLMNPPGNYIYKSATMWPWQYFFLFLIV